MEKENEGYTCGLCGYQTDKKFCIIKHLQRKTPCNSLCDDTNRTLIIGELTKRNLLETTYPCDHCGKQFNTRPGKCRHQKICKNKPVQQEIVNINTEHSHNTNHSHNTTNNTTNNNNTMNNNNTNVNVNVEIREFGHENMAALPNSSIRDNILFLNHIDILEMLHFDKDFPENNNFRLVSLKQEIMEFYKNKKWYCVSLMKGIDDLIRHTCRIFRNYYNSNKDEVEEDMGEEEVDKMLDDLEATYKCDSKVVKELRGEMKALLYNYRKNLVG